jgi:enoyl-CoA hydratase
MRNNLIKVDIADHIAVVKMDNAPVNAYSRDFSEELIEVFDEINDTPEIRCVVITGREKIFSAGADIKNRQAIGDIKGETFRHMRRARETSNCIMECSKAVISSSRPRTPSSASPRSTSASWAASATSPASFRSPSPGA